MKVVIIGAILILAAFLIVLRQIPIGIEPLTELYFENHTRLPKEAELNRTYDFSFTINNLEYQNMTYTYTILAVYNDTQVLLRENNVTLENNQSVTIPERFLIQDPFDRARIEVTIKGNQTIHFWVKAKKG